MIYQKYYWKIKMEQTSHQMKLKTTHEPTVYKKFIVSVIVVSCRFKVERSFARIAMNANAIV